MNRRFASQMNRALRLAGNFWMPPPTVEQDLVAFANNSPALKADYNTAEVINAMQLVGLKELRAVTSFSVHKTGVTQKVHAELAAKGVPPDVIKAITSNLETVTKYANSMEDFAVDSEGTGKIFKATVMMKPDADEQECVQVAMAVSGAEFNAAKVVDHYETEVIPQWVDEEHIKQYIESGFFGDYKVLKSVIKKTFVGNHEKKTPVFKQHVFSKGKLETIKKFLEGKTLDEVKLLYGNNTTRDRNNSL